MYQEYDWNEKHKSYILSSFYWGYILTLCPGSFLCRRYGAKVVLFVACFGTAAFSLMTPWCISWGGWQVFCAIRILQGLFQGVIFPCVTEHLAMWSPPEERNRLGAFSYTGTDCGTVLAMFISGMIAKGAMGWPGISYVSGSLCAAWCFLWLIFASNNATESRFIGESECKYIESSLQHNEDFHERTIPIPWKAIWTSVPFLALLVTRCSETYGLSTLQAEIPSYMNGVLNMDIQSNAVFSSLPFLAMWLLSYVYLIAADLLLKKKILSLTSVRKLFNTMSFWIPAAALIGIGFLNEDHKKLAIILMTVSVGVNSGATIGSSLNTIDLSPNHAGILIGLSNTVANVIPILTPLIAGEIVTDKVSHPPITEKPEISEPQVNNNFLISRHSTIAANGRSSLDWRPLYSFLAMWSLSYGARPRHSPGMPTTTCSPRMRSPPKKSPPRPMPRSPHPSIPFWSSKSPGQSGTRQRPSSDFLICGGSGRRHLNN